MADIQYNLSAHPRKTYGGMSRWRIHTDSLNPKLKPVNHGVLARYIGYKTSTSIRNSKEVQVQGMHFQLSHVEDLAKLQPNNLKVTAYYLYDHNDKINEVYIYQGDKFISRCNYIAPYNEAKAEWTDADVASFTEQSKYDAQYRKMVKGSKIDIPNVKFIEEVEVVTTPVITPKAERKKRESTI